MKSPVEMKCHPVQALINSSNCYFKLSEISSGSVTPQHRVKHKFSYFHTSKTTDCNVL